MRWTIALLLFFATMFGMNATLIYVAFSGAEPIAESYEAERR